MDKKIFSEVEQMILREDLAAAWPILEVLQGANDAEAEYLLGRYYRVKGDFAAAIRHYSLSLQLSPKNNGTLHALGIAYQQSGEYDKAIVALKNSIEVGGDPVLAWTRIGMTHRMAGKLDEAIAAYTNGLKKLVGEAYQALVGGRLPRPRFSQEHSTGVNEPKWMELALEAAHAFAANDGFHNISFPTGATALAIIDSPQRDDIFRDEDEKTRFVLPNFFSSIYLILKSDTIYSQLLSNFAAIYILKDELDLAEKLTRESIEMIPKGANFPGPTNQLAVILAKKSA